MVREFSEEKRQEIFRLLDEIDNREWKSFMEWCGSSAEEFGDWPDRLAVSAYTKYVDEYHKKVLETNEMTRNRVNTVFENVAEIETRYAGRMKECQEKVKGQIAMVNTMTEFMVSITDVIPNKAHRSGGGSYANGYRSVDDDEEENTEIPVVIDAAETFYPGYTETGQQILTQCLIDHNITDSDKINRVLEWTMENDSWKFIELTQASYSDNYNENAERIYQKIMGNYYEYQIEGARGYFLLYTDIYRYKERDWVSVVDILQLHNPELLIRFDETNNDEEKAEIFNLLLEDYNEYKIEQAAIILEDFIKGNSEILEDDQNPEFIVRFFRVFYPNKLIYLYQIVNDAKDSSAGEAYCESLVEISKNYDKYQIFYAYTWLQINSIESFTNNNLDDADFDAALAEFVFFYEKNEAVYIDIAEETGIPPQLIAVIHYRENPQDFINGTFDIRLHDGHSLDEPYTYLNKNGEQETITFNSFKDAAIHAIQLKQSYIDNPGLSSDSTDIVAMICYAEAFNGLGYYNHNRISPYSYSGTDVYISGKYTSDGNYKENVIDRQIGTYRLLLASVAGIYDVENGKNYVNEMY